MFVLASVTQLFANHVLDTMLSPREVKQNGFGKKINAHAVMVQGKLSTKRLKNKDCKNLDFKQRKSGNRKRSKRNTNSTR